MVLIIDNYDSFTYNLVQRIGELGAEIEVYRHDRITIEGIAERGPTHLVVSPGPCTPTESGVSNDAIRHFAGRLPILGVCLGHQCIAHAFGGRVLRAKRLMHGKTSLIEHDGRSVYELLENPFVATRYHSLIVEEETLPRGFVVTARTADDRSEVMGIRHEDLPLEGVQFHPESFLTIEGVKLLGNFLRM